MSARPLEPGARTYEFEVAIEASRERVWEALTAETDAWWLADFRMTGEGSCVQLDATAGGQLVERAPDGASLLWYTVQMVVPESSLHLVGHLGPKFGGPATTLLELALVDQEGGVVLKVTDALYGSVGDGGVGSLEAGWRQLFTEGLKAHVER